MTPTSNSEARKRAETGRAPKKYRKKPVEIEAMQWTGTKQSIHNICRWANDLDPTNDPWITYVTTAGFDAVLDPVIETLEGVMHISPGDWIIRGVQGEFYPCKPGIFAAIYEAVE